MSNIGGDGGSELIPTLRTDSFFFFISVSGIYTSPFLIFPSLSFNFKDISFSLLGISNMYTFFLLTY